MLPDCRVLDTLGVEMDADLFTQTPAAAAGLEQLGSRRPGGVAPDHTAGRARRPGYGQAVLATSRQMIDDGSLQVDEPALAGTARRPYVKVNAATAERLALVEGAEATVRTDRGRSPCRSR